MSAAAILELSGVARAFGGVQALADLSFAVERGAVAGLMGPNGAGKTTVINLITGLLTPDAGRIVLDGHDLCGRPPQHIAGFGIARTYQNVRLFSGMTALEQVVAGSFLRRGTSMLASFLGTPGSRAAMRRTRAEAMALLERVGLADRAHLLAEALSYGEQRRIEIARALGSQPKLLLLDEPTAGMNAGESQVIGRLLHTLRDDGLTILMVEHNIRLVSDFCDHVAVMSFGRKLTEGTPAACLAHPDVQEAYFGRKRTPPAEGESDAQRARSHG